MNSQKWLAALPRLWTPPERLSLSKWSEKHLVLSAEYSARSGPIQLYGYQRAIFDAFTDPDVREIVLMCGTQLVKSLLLQAIIAYTIAVEPLPVLVIQPKEDAAKKFSKRRISPMLRDTKALHGLVVGGKEDTIQEKTFPGGSLTILGGGSPTNLASASIGILLIDEVDKLELNVGGHSDPVAQAKARLSTYGSRAKMVVVCSPTDEHTSKIARHYQESDQRQAWVPCHKCGHSQVLRFAQVKWDKDAPKTARYECEECKALWTDLERWQNCERVEWRGQKPFDGIAGFTISHLYSPWHKLADIAKEFLRTKNDVMERKTFINNTLAELWKVEGHAPDEEKLFARRESYPFGDDAIIPDRALFLTAATDVQADRLEVEVVAWGRDKESWSVAYEVIQVFAADNTPLPTTDSRVWDELNRRVLQRDWTHAGGGVMSIMLMAIDCGFNAPTVYDFVLKHPQLSHSPTGMRVRAPRSVVPVRGASDDLQIIASTSTENAARKRKNIRIVSVGSVAKTEVYEILRNIRPDDNGAAVPQCAHFPMYDLDYFRGLCSENRLVKANGQHVWEKKPNARNEPLDLRVYNRGAAELIGISRFAEHHWAQLERGLGRKVQVAAPVAPAEPAVSARPVTPQMPPPTARPRRTVMSFL